jgi:hypothetical protein
VALNGIRSPRHYEKSKLDRSSHCGWFDIMAGELLSRDNGFFDQASLIEREIVRKPSVDAAFERANPGDAFGSQQ